MKTIEYYMALPYRLEIVPDPDEGGYVARYPDLPGCITVGDSMEEAAKMLKMRRRSGWPQPWKAEWRLQNRYLPMDIPDSLSCGSPKACTAVWPNTPKKKESA